MVQCQPTPSLHKLSHNLMADFQGVAGVGCSIFRNQVDMHKDRCMSHVQNIIQINVSGDMRCRLYDPVSFVVAFFGTE